MLVPTTALLQELLAAAIDHTVSGNFTGPLYAPYVMLFSGNPTLTQNTVLADLTEAVYTGYARLSIGALGTPYVSTDGSAAVDSGVLQFMPSGTITQTDYITGWALVSLASAGVLLAAEMLQTPKQMATLLDSLSIVAKLEIPPQLVPGYGVIID